MFLKTLLVLCVAFREGMGKGLFGDFKGALHDALLQRAEKPVSLNQAMTREIGFGSMEENYMYVQSCKVLISKLG